jgi:hypothetical protein
MFWDKCGAPVCPIGQLIGPVGPLGVLRNTDESLSDFFEKHGIPEKEWVFFYQRYDDNTEPHRKLLPQEAVAKTLDDLDKFLEGS